LGEPSRDNDDHRWQWRQTVTDYCAAIRDTPVDAVDTAAVLRVLKPCRLRRDPRLCGIDVPTAASPSALEMLEQGILDSPTACRACLSLRPDAEARLPGERSIGTGGCVFVCAFGERDSYFQCLGGGSRVHTFMRWAPTPVGLGLMPLAPTGRRPKRDNSSLRGGRAADRRMIRLP
jgi:hypothetical protein